jgi:hypothetical protein
VKKARIEAIKPVEEVKPSKVTEPEKVAPAKHIRNISADGMFANTVDEVEPYCNMIFKIDAKVLNIETEEIYGKVVKAIKREDACEMHVEFTTINPEDRAAIKDLVKKTEPHNT